MKNFKDIETRRIGAKIKEIRRKRGMSQKELASKANISLSHMSEIETGRQVLMLPTFIRIIDALNISANEILKCSDGETIRLYESELLELLSGCSNDQFDSILRIIKEIKNQYQPIKQNEDEHR